MRLIPPLLCIAIILYMPEASRSQGNDTLTPTPRPVTITQLNAIDSLDGQLVQINAVVRHTDTAHVFTLGAEQGGPEVHVVVPQPAIDAANVGDPVAITGFIRRFDSGAFERDYSWFRKADYPDLKGGDRVIVATSVRTPEGTELVPSGVISNTPATGKTR